MAETNVKATMNGAEHTQPPETMSKTLAASIAPDIPVPVGPDMTDSKIVAPSNVIVGSFGEKRSVAVEAERQVVEQDKTEMEMSATKEQPPVKKEPLRDRPPKADKDVKASEASKSKKTEHAPHLPKGLKEEKQATGGGSSRQSAGKEESPAAPTEPEPPAPPKDATRPGETETIQYINHAELFPFKNHPFQVRDDEAMKTLTASVKERGIDQPAIVRPRESGGYEIIAGHRRQHAAEMAGYVNVPCVVRNMTNDEAVLAMAESNFNQRAEILPSERSQALKMQLEAIKHQGAKIEGQKNGEPGKRSNEIVAERNKMTVKQVQRYIALSNLIPDLLKLVDEKKIPFTPAVEMSYIKPKNQRYIAVAIDAQQSAPSLTQSQRMRELDQKGVLNGDVIDGIMLEEKKEDIRVILNSQELGKYFGPEKSPREMKDQILQLLDDWKEKHPPELAKPAKKQEQEK